MRFTVIIRRLIGVIAGLALAIGLAIGATAPAEAAKRTVWDRVASCESGGRWHINTGNGYTGGLQFSGATWRAYGGKKYASTAGRATKAEQIAVARRVLSRQGAGAWPTCGRRAGLTKSNGKANRHATPASNPGASKAAKSSAAKKKSAAKSKAAKKKTAATKSSAKKSSATKSVKVRHGDTLAKLAKRHHVSGGWKHLWKLNKKKLKSPNRIHVGQVLRIK